METFYELFDALSPAAAEAMETNEGSPLRSIFEDEHVLHRHVADGSIVDLTGHRFDVDQVPEEVREVLELHKVIYDARATLVREYVERAGADPLKYAEGIPGLPVPAVFFYPRAVSKKQGYVNGVAVEDIDERRDDLHIIRAHRNEAGKFVVIGGHHGFRRGKALCRAASGRSHCPTSILLSEAFRGADGSVRRGGR